MVFVDFTADWCLSCKVNERVALAGEDFDAALRDHSVVAMKADWTRADPRITDALIKHLNTYFMIRIYACQSSQKEYIPV